MEIIEWSTYKNVVHMQSNNNKLSRLSQFKQQSERELRSKGVSVRKTVQILECSKDQVHRLDKRQHSSSSNGKNKQPHDMIIPSSKLLLDRPKGLAAWNKEIGLPTKPKVGELPIFLTSGLYSTP